jgi:precorrin-6A/cobalt-precorrin-6A reductase
VILARGPFTIDAEVELMRDARVDALVTKNSGGEATRAKLDAARALGLEVVLIRRPQSPSAPIFHTLEAVMDYLQARHSADP